jgi:hypothetical protein
MNKIITFPLIAILILFMSGCVSFVPPDNSPFAVIHEIKDLDGTYYNAGIGRPSDAPNARVPCLSQIIWRNDKEINHKEISSIQVKAIDEKSLSIKAIGKNGIIKEDIFQMDKDFSLSTGRIPFNSIWGVPLPIVGIGYQSSEIGIDQRKDGKYKESTTVIGLFALLIPLFISGSEEFRYGRINLNSNDN